MRRFNFTLQALLTLRQQQEQEALNHYGKTLLVRVRAVEQVTATEHEMSVLQHAWVEGMARGFSSSAAMQFQAHEQALAERRKKNLEDLGHAERAVNQALQSMLLARQQREAVDKFYERQKAAHDRAMTRDEQKMLDDLAGRARNSPLAWQPEIAL